MGFNEELMKEWIERRTRFDKKLMEAGVTSIMGRRVLFSYFDMHGFKNYTGKLVGYTHWGAKTFYLIEDWDKDREPIVVSTEFFKKVLK